MKCTVCGARMGTTITDMPFKLAEERIVIIKKLPVLQCGSCREYLIEDAVMQRIDLLLNTSHAASTVSWQVGNSDGPSQRRSPPFPTTTLHLGPSALESMLDLCRRAAKNAR